MPKLYYQPAPNPFRVAGRTASMRVALARVGALKQRHPFKSQMDEEARRHLFPQL
jgi:hypothetical protein